MLPILAVVMLGLSQAGRAGIYIVILQLVLAAYLKNVLIFRHHPIKYVLVRGLFLSPILFGVFIGGQLIREGFGAAEIEDIFRIAPQLRAYLFGGVSAYSTWIAEVYDWDFTLGRYTFAALFDVLGLAPQEIGIYDSYLRISPSGETSNVYTAYRSFIDDFSIIGACICYMMLGVFTGSVAIRLMRGQMESVAILVPLLSFLTFSPMASLTYFNSFLLSCFAPYILVRMSMSGAIITPLRKYDLHRESSGIPDVLAVEETLDHIGLPLATAQV